MFVELGLDSMFGVKRGNKRIRIKKMKKLIKYVFARKLIENGLEVLP
jgi:hypothetical protein